MSIEGEALVVRTMGRVGLYKFVVQKESWNRNKVEHSTGIENVWDLEYLVNEEFGVVYAIFQSVGVDLF